MERETKTPPAVHVVLHLNVMSMLGTGLLQCSQSQPQFTTQQRRYNPQFCKSLDQAIKKDPELKAHYHNLEQAIKTDPEIFKAYESCLTRKP